MSRERDLEIALKNEITKIFEHDSFFDESGTQKSLNVYKHSLPNNYYGNEQVHAPYIIAEVNGSTEDKEKIEMQVVFTLCVCDGIVEGAEDVNKNIHCEDDLFHIKNKIVERFKKSDVLDNKYICGNEWQFALVDDNTAPIYYAGLAVKFSAVITETENGYNQDLL